MFKNHKDVPKTLVKDIKEFFNVDNIKDLDINEINDYCSDYTDRNTTFEVVASINNNINKFNFDNLKEALVQCDRLTDYDKGTDHSIVLYQDKKIVKFYHDRQWNFVKNSIYQ